MMTNSEIENNSPENGAFYLFGEFCLDSNRNILTASGEQVPLTYKALQTLLVLVENQGRIVTKNELLDRVWRDTFVEENSLTRNISVLRKVLGETPNSNKFIETVPRRGYRFIAEVTKNTDSKIRETGVKNLVSINEFENYFPANSENGMSKTIIPEKSSVLDFEEKPSAKSGEKNFNVESKIKLRAIKRHWIPALLLVLIFAAIASIFFRESIKKYFSGGSATVEVARVAVSKFTNTGNAEDAAISLDGKYVVYVAADGARQSLLVKQTSDGGSQAIQIFPPSEVSFQGLAFAPGSDFVYYNVWDRKGVGEVFRIPVLGGVPTKIVHDCMPSIDVSPFDGKIAFIRGYARENEHGLVVADADGGAEKLIARFNYNEWIASAAWSPDGKNLTVAVGSSNPPKKGYVQLREISLETGEQKSLGEKKWVGINRISRLSDGHGLIVNGADETQKFPQLWKVALPSGEAQKLTSEASGYGGISNITADGTTLVSVQHSINYNIWTAPANQPSDAAKITDGRNEGSGASWTRDGRIIFTSFLDANPSIWIMQADGNGKKQLTGGNSLDYNPVASPADGWIYFVSNRSDRAQIWRMDENGQNLKQMTEDYAGSQHSISPDGKWLIYVRDVPGSPSTLWKIPTDGTDSPQQQQLTDQNSHAPSVSPDGKFIAYSFWNENHDPPQWAREIISLADGEKIKPLSFPSTANIGDGAIELDWLPDQSGIAYIDFRDKTSNVWVQPLDEKKSAYKLTDFRDGRVFQFNYSPDGKKILFVRGNELSDVVLVKLSEIK